jgi:hypothetical protein
MSKTTRRNVLKAVAGGGLAAGVGLALKPGSAPGAATPSPEERGHRHSRINGPLASATVSFGQWPTDPPLDRSPNLSPLNRNVHQLVPNEVTIQAGGSVNFIIAGAHQVIVYGNRTQPEDIDTSLLVPPAAAPPGSPPILINDPKNRIYRGLDFSTLPLLSIPPNPPNALTPPFLMDRVEVVNFPKPGIYLVICGVVFHFVNDEMFGYVRVLP